MKKIMFAAVLFLTVGLMGLRNWESYTNTTHIFDSVKIGNTLYLATWGGLIEFDWQTKSYGQTLKKADGLVDNDIRSLFFDEESEIFYVGTKNGGLSRIKDGEFLLPITTTLGLQSDFVKQIEKKGNRLFYATDRGLSVFIDDPTASIPLLEINLTEENGLTNRNISALAVSDSHLFCASVDGVSYAPVDSVSYYPAWQTLPITDYGNVSNMVNSLAINSSEDKLAIATTNGLLILSLPDFSLISLLQGDELGGEDSIYPVFWDVQGDLWLSSGKWNEEALMVQDTGDKAITRIRNVGESNQIIHHITIHEQGAERVMGFNRVEDKIISLHWGQGFYMQKDLGWEQFISNCIVTNYVTDMKLDKTGALWIINGLPGGEQSSKAMKGVSSFNNSIWTNIYAETSPLISNNLTVLEVDDYNRKWFGTWHTIPGTDWQRGVHIFDDTADEWIYLPSGGSNGLLNYLVSDIDFVSEDEIWVSTFDGGVQIFNSEIELLWSASAYHDATNKIVKIKPHENYCFIGTWYKGLEYWHGDGFPDSNLEDYWHQPLANVLRNGKIYDITVRQSSFKTEFWVASVNGLFMFDEETWYRYGTTQKKQFLAGFNNWQPQNITEVPYNTPEFWYVEGQERLFGSVTTFPRVIYVDIYNRLWIGTQGNGFTIFSPDEDTYKTYNQNNSPLLSNTVTSFEYEPVSGTMYIGTDNGLNSVEIGFMDEYNTQTKLVETIAYPNPFHPERGFPLTIINEESRAMPSSKTTARIYDLNGQLVHELEKDRFQEFTWDGTNQNGAKCSSGIYFYVVSTDDGQISRGKIILIR